MSLALLRSLKILLGVAMIKKLRRIVLVMGIVFATILTSVTPSQAAVYATSGVVDQYGTVVVYSTWRYHAAGEALWATQSLYGCGGAAYMYLRGPDGGQRTNWLTMGATAAVGARNFIRNDTVTSAWIIGAGSYATNAKGNGYGCPNGGAIPFSGYLTL